MPVMRATLVFNAKAGSAASETHVRAALERLGWQVEHSLPNDRLEEALRPRPEVVAVAGGDGTVADVARLLAGTGVPLAIVPMGTANNIARSLGIGVDAEVAIDGLARPAVKQMDLGVVEAEGVEPSVFVEGFGVGVFADVLAERATKSTKKLERALTLLASEVEAYEPRPITLDVDGHDHSGEYVLAAMMNTRSLGPALEIAPDAQCDDRLLDVVVVPADARGALAAHLRRAATEGPPAGPKLPVVRGSRVRIRADGAWGHADDRTRALRGDVTVRVAAGAVHVLAPHRGRSSAWAQ
jgi:diacylglycerol kinase family enzyme